ncbi:MAG: hypothetical protein COA79_16045 [Planctomycetota bacterium]|nr:MAG: hypothetical protein COA79_16045 [Planctomycetota bacterium]
MLRNNKTNTINHMIKVCLLLLCCLSFNAHVTAEDPEKNRWHEEMLIIPDTYDPLKKWPIINVVQEMIDDVQLKGTPYFAAYGTNPTVILAGANKFNFDPKRIYGTAFSRSGHGMLEDAWKYPHRYAAIAPVCNDLRVKTPRYSEAGQKNLYVRYLQQTPVHLIHGDRDSFVKTGKVLHNIMVKHNCPVEWSTFPGGHSPYGMYYRNMKPILNFFDKHPYKPWPKEVIHVVYKRDATRAFWVDSKMGSLKAFGNKNPFPSWKIKIKESNVIDVVQADETVKALVFHLNKNLIDMKKDVKVLFKEKTIYKGSALAVLEVKIHEGEAKTNKTPIPFSERLETFYKTPQESGSYDWIYLMMNTNFQDLRYDNTVPRRIFIDLGFREKGATKKELIDPTSKKFVAWDVMQEKSNLDLDTSSLKRKLSVKVNTFSKKFSLQGVLDTADASSALLAPSKAKSGEVILVKVRLKNNGKTDLDVSTKINRTVFRQYKQDVFPKSGDGKNFYYGIWEMSGTRQVRWQWLKHGNEAYQVFGYVMLNPGNLPEASRLDVSGGNWGVKFYGAKRDLILKAGESIEFPVLLISANAPDSKAKKPAYPDLGKIIDTLKPALMSAYKELGK